MKKLLIDLSYTGIISYYIKARTRQAAEEFSFIDTYVIFTYTHKAPKRTQVFQKGPD